MYQNKRQHDLGTYWPAYSNPGNGQFNNATPERIPIPDRVLSAGAQGPGRFRARSPSSRTARTTSATRQDSYQGTVYDLMFYQALGWPNALYPGAPAFGCGSASTTPTQPCSWYPLLDGKGIHMPPGFAGYSTPNTMTNQQRAWTQEFRLQSNDPDSRWNWTAGVFWSLARELSIEQLNDPQHQSVVRRRCTACECAGQYLRHLLLLQRPGHSAAGLGSDSELRRLPTTQQRQP